MKIKFLFFTGILFFALMGAGIPSDNSDSNPMLNENCFDNEEFSFFESAILESSDLDLMTHEEHQSALKALNPGDPFITVWKTDNPGYTNSNQIIIKVEGEYIYTWEEIGNLTNTGTGAGNDDLTITFPNPGTYRVYMEPTGTIPFDRIYFPSSGNTAYLYYDAKKLLEVEQWGDIVWSSFNSAFTGTSNLNITATDIPHLSNVSSMEFAFAASGISNVPGINTWDFTNITNIKMMFNGALNFNQPIGDWNVSNVTNMSGLFLGASSFNQSIENWDVSNVIDMSGIFQGASSFNQPLGTWNLNSLQNSPGTGGFSFYQAGLSCENYGLTLQGWANNPNTSSDISMLAHGLTYDIDVDITAARNHLVNNLNWTILGDTQEACLAKPYITVWKTDNPGTLTNDEQIFIPATGEFDYTWEEIGNPANTGSGSGSDYTIVTFPQAGTYRVAITPTGSNPFSNIGFWNHYDPEKILELEQWGDVDWIYFDGSYAGCSNLVITATDIPDLSLVTNMNSAFRGASSITTIPNMNYWDVSNVTTMLMMFYEATNFNQPIGDWNVSNVQNMTWIFYEASSFDQPIDNWNVSNVENMNGMFYNASSFNQPLSSWNVSNVENMYTMFAFASSFNQPLSSWNVSNVENISYMFYEAFSFNQPIGNWNVSNVTEMAGIFENAVAFDQNLGDWNLSSLINDSFYNEGFNFSSSGMSCENYSLTLQGWANNPDTASDLNITADGMEYSPDVTGSRDTLTNDFNWTFNGDTQGTCLLNPVTVAPYITVWNTGTTGASNADQITIPASGEFTYTWEEVSNTSNTGSGTGNGSTTITFPHSGAYRVSMTPTGSNPFHQIAFTGVSDNKKLSAVEQWGDVEWSSFENAYHGCTNLTVTAADTPDLDSVTDMSYAFAQTGFVFNISNVNAWDVSNVTNMSHLFDHSGFNSDISGWDVSSVTDMSSMFKSQHNRPAFNQDISGWDVSSVLDMSNMFYYNDHFNQPIGSWNVGSVTNMKGLFQSAISFNQPLGDWNVSNVTNLENAFAGSVVFNQPIGNWDVSSVTTMGSMFGTALAFNQDISGWDVSSVTNMIMTFAKAKSFNHPIENWDVSNVTNMSSMFWEADSFNQPLGDWDVSSVTNMNNIFYMALSFNQSLADWDLTSMVSNPTNNDISFRMSAVDCENYSLTLQAWAGNSNTPALNIKLDADGRQYAADILTDRNHLTGTLGWSIYGDTQGTCLLNPINCDSGIHFISHVSAYNPGDANYMVNNTGYDGPETDYSSDSSLHLVIDRANPDSYAFTFRVEADGGMASANPDLDYQYEIWIDRNQDGLFENGEYTELFYSGGSDKGYLEGTFDLEDFGGCNHAQGTFQIMIKMNVYDTDCEETYSESEIYLAQITGECTPDPCSIDNYYISYVHAAGPGSVTDENTTGFDNDTSGSNPAITTPVTTPGYGDYSNIVYTLNKSAGDTFSFQIKSEPADTSLNFHYDIWVDRNEDGVLSNDGWGDYLEHLINIDIPGGDMAYTFDLDDPILNGIVNFCEIPNRDYPLRIIMTVYDEDCQMLYGETEDYTLRIEGDCNDRLDVDTTDFTGFNFYPNPVSSTLNLDANQPIEKVELYNLLGQRVLEINPDNTQTQINTQALSSGVYMMKVIIEGVEKTFKVVRK